MKIIIGFNAYLLIRVVPTVPGHFYHPIIMGSAGMDPHQCAPDLILWNNLQFLLTLQSEDSEYTCRYRCNKDRASKPWKGADVPFGLFLPADLSAQLHWFCSVLFRPPTALPALSSVPLFHINKIDNNNSTYIT